MSNTAYNIAIEDAACKIDEVWRKYKDSIEAPGCTELCAAVRSLKRGIKEVEPLATEMKDQDGHPVEVLVPTEPWPGGVTFQWYYVRLNNYGPNDARASGWFPTLELAHMHREAWPFTMQEHMVIIPEGNPNAPFNDKKAPEQMHGSTERALKKFMNDQALEEMIMTTEIKEAPRDIINEIFEEHPIDDAQSKWLFKEGMLVKKKSGSWWAGTIVGTYSTKQTPRGYNVQLATPGDNGPVQIYPEDALVPASPAELTNR